jgi:MoaA/NifB/PqqE/SkfB family radical SAM enzyme
MIRETGVRMITKTLSHEPRAPLALVPQYFGSVVFDRRTSRYLPFDSEATSLLRCLKGENIDSVLQNAVNEEASQRIQQFYQDFYRAGFFSIDGKFVGEILEVDVPQNHLVGPLALHLEVVAACNLSCTHCFAGELPRKENPLTLDELDDLFRQMASLGTYRLGLTGGEPLLRRDLFQIIDLALNHGLCPCVTTNGLLITEEIAREFGKRELVWLNVSLEGASSATNDPIRGLGSFDRAIERIRVLRKHSKFTLAFTILASNLGEIQACAALARQLGAGTAVFRPLYPVGVARHHLDLMPTFEQYNDALNELASLQDGSQLRDLDPFGPFSRHGTQSIVYQNHGCGAGNLVCSVSVSGDVSPCSFLGPAWYGASVRQQSLRQIWAESARFQAIRSLPDAEAFDSGPGAARFSGGCRARALVLNGSANAPDPWLSSHAQLTADSSSRDITIHHPSEVMRLTALSPAPEQTFQDE